MRERVNADRVLVRKPEGRRLGRSRRGWEKNVKTDLRDIGCIGLDWTDLASDKDQWQGAVNTVMNLPAGRIYLSAG